jgi:hypothetical protein
VPKGRAAAGALNNRANAKAHSREILMPWC